MRSRRQAPGMPCINNKGRTESVLPLLLERKTGLGPALCASDGRDSLSTPPAPEKGALRLRGQAPGMPCINNKRENRTGSPFVVGAENGTRTRDLNLGKVALYQLSYFRMTSPKPALRDCKYRMKIRSCKIFDENNTFSEQKSFIRPPKPKKRPADTKGRPEQKRHSGKTGVPFVCGIAPFAAASFSPSGQSPPERKLSRAAAVRRPDQRTLKSSSARTGMGSEA